MRVFIADVAALTRVTLEQRQQTRFTIDQKDYQGEIRTNNQKKNRLGTQITRLDRNLPISSL